MAKFRLQFILAALIAIFCLTPAHAAKYAQTFEALLTSQRAGGVTLAGGKVYFYVPGTTTLKAIYTDRNKTTPAANPYTLSSDGTAQVFGDGLYDIKLTNSSLVQKALWEDVKIQDSTADSQSYLISDYNGDLAAAVAAIGAVNDASLTIDTNATVSANLTITSNITVIVPSGKLITIASGKTLTTPIPDAGSYQIFTGAGNVALVANGRDINALWIGVKNDGTTDNNDSFVSTTSPFGKMVSMLPASGFRLVIPPGTYRYSHTIAGIVRSNFEIYAVGATFKAMDGTSTTAAGHGCLNFYQSDNFRVIGLTVDGNRDNRPALVPVTSDVFSHNIVIQGSTNFLFDKVKSMNGSNDGFILLAVTNSDTSTFPKNGMFRDCISQNNGRQAVSILEGWDIKFEHCQLTDTNGLSPEAGVDFEPNSGSVSSIRNVVFDSCIFEGNAGYCFQQDTTYGSADNTRFIGANDFENCTKGAMYIDSPTYVDGASFHNFTNITSSRNALVDFMLDPRASGEIANSRFYDLALGSAKYTILLSGTGATNGVSGGTGNIALRRNVFSSMSSPVQVSSNKAELDGNIVLSADVVPFKINAMNVHAHHNIIMETGINVGIEQGSGTTGFVMTDNVSYATNGYLIQSGVNAAVAERNYVATGFWAGNIGGGTAPRSGSGAPSSTPVYVGQEYYDFTNGKWYKARGTTSSADWLILN